MLDDLHVLRDAAAAYRAAAVSAGMIWPDRPNPDESDPPDLVYRLFDVDHVADQLIWLQSLGWHAQLVLPDGGLLLPWPTDPDAAVDLLSFSVAIPFPWRHQLPLLHFGRLVYTFVLAGDREGEIWRYEISPDSCDPVRAAISLAALFSEWTKGIAADVVIYLEADNWLHVGDDLHDPLKVLMERAPHLDPFAFPVSFTTEPLLKTRQRECGIDLDRVDLQETRDELQHAIAATLASLDL